MCSLTDLIDQRNHLIQEWNRTDFGEYREETERELEKVERNLTRELNDHRIE